MNLEKLLAKPVQPKTVDVEHDGETYVLSGMPDNYILNIKMSDPGKFNTLARHYTELAKQRGTDVKYTPEDVVQIMLVDRYLSPDENGKKASDVQIAFLAKEHGPLFIKLFAAVEQILSGGKPNPAGTHEVDDLGTTVGLKNSSAEEPKEEPSSSSATSRATGVTRKKS
jgi:hypothetical protein